MTALADRPFNGLTLAQWRQRLQQRERDGGASWQPLWGIPGQRGCKAHPVALREQGFPVFDEHRNREPLPRPTTAQQSHNNGSRRAAPEQERPFWEDGQPDWPPPPQEHELNSQPRDDHGSAYSDLIKGIEGLREKLTESPGTLESAKASDVEMRAARWVWRDRFARGKIGIIGGLPDRGKGQIAAYLIAKVTRGGEWPCNEGRAPQGIVILLTAEDDLEDTVVPRLVAAGADLDRVHIIKMVKKRDGKKTTFSILADLDLLRQKIKEVGGVLMIIIDPVTAYMGVGKVDGRSTTDVRGALQPLKQLAEETMTSVICIMHFNKKEDTREVMLRISDSLAYVALARHLYAVLDDAKNNRRLFVKGKNNVAQDMPGLSYTIAAKKVGVDPETGEGIYAPYVVWGDEPVTDVTANEAMEVEATGKQNKDSRGALETAKRFLRDRLAAGPVIYKDIKAEADANGIAKRTLVRAKDALQIVPKRNGFGEGSDWVWGLPAPTKRGNDD
jgi:putative DNA primase/helicase